MAVNEFNIGWLIYSSLFLWSLDLFFLLFIIILVVCLLLAEFGSFISLIRSAILFKRCWVDYLIYRFIIFSQEKTNISTNNLSRFELGTMNYDKMKKTTFYYWLTWSFVINIIYKNYKKDGIWFKRVKNTVFFYSNGRF